MPKLQKIAMWEAGFSANNGVNRKARHWTNGGTCVSKSLCDVQTSQLIDDFELRP